VLVVNAKLADRELGWIPEYSDLHSIVEHAWQWEIINGEFH